MPLTIKHKKESIIYLFFNILLEEKRIIMTIESFFTPKNVCLIGASDNKGSVGNTISNNLNHYKGKVFFVNPRLSGKKLLGKQVFKSVTDIKENIDLAVIATPAAITYDVVKEIAKTKCKNILMITSGFSEIGRTDLTEKIKKLITKEKINLIGPNCLGILNLTNGLDATFNSREKYDLPKPGKVSIITQSGALGLAILDLASKEQLDINKFVSYGNALDIDESDLLEYFQKDKTTDIILCYIEGVQNGKKFFTTLKKVSKTKKVIILKGGITDKGTTAVKSHTAAIAGSSKVFSAAIKQAGAIQVSTIREMFNLSKFYSWYKEDKIKDIQIITNGGGFGVLTTDQLELEKIKLSTLSENTKAEIKNKVPIYASIGNPIDLTGDADDKRFNDIINLCLKDKNTNAIVVLMLLQLPSISKEIPKEIAEIKNKNKKPVFILTIGGNKTEGQVKEFEKRKVLCFKDPKDLSDILRLLK
jgi:acyl-CoA synthetase (NDP forming)